jgi:ArsR family transcriptional regulator, cadmium/lead-responsive transcriptional repressor
MAPRVAETRVVRQARLLRGLSDESRLGILVELRGGERRVSELVERTGLSQPNVSKHLACLWGCGLVARERRGREVFYRSIEGLDELLAAADAVLAVQPSVGSGLAPGIHEMSGDSPHPAGTPRE